MQIDPSSTYHKVYREFLRFFQECGPIDEHVFILGANMVYGWMPTILDLYGTDLGETAAILNGVRMGERLSCPELERMKGAVNRSVVGVSKLLHFISPNSYPIWDRRVCTFINSVANIQHRKAREDDVSDYMSYVGNCDELVKQDGFHAIHCSVIAKVGYEVSVYRAVELAMYEGGKALLPVSSATDEHNLTS